MPRIARTISPSGYYHIMLRRAGRQILFEDNADRQLFINTVESVFAEECVDVIAWCLMDNHVHLVVSDAMGNLSHAMQRVTLRYAQHLNRRTGYIGHVFQDRFLSKPLDSDAYLLEAVRYTHNNPAAAHICAARDYPWSSYAEYAFGRPGLTNTDIILDMVGSPEEFERFIAERPGIEAADIMSFAGDSDALIKRAELILGQDVAKVGELPKKERDEKIRALGGSGFSIRQIERLTGIGRNTVARALKG